MVSTEELGGRVSKLEEDVSDLRVETAKIGTALDALKETAGERHDDIKESLGEIKEALKCEDPHLSRQARWLKDILTPQTIAIVLAVLASALGAPMVAEQILSTVPTTPAAIAPVEEADEADEAEGAEEAPEKEEEAAPATKKEEAPTPQ
jgi:hypothetical protein